jgi:Zn finger protein HypA/HybF involved in hydrogenase expression
MGAIAEAILASAQQIAEQEDLTSICEVTYVSAHYKQFEPSILRFALKQMATAP